MSSRALRRLQREEEERKQKKALQLDGDIEEDDEEDDHHNLPALKSQKNAFNFLNDEEDEDEDMSMEDNEHKEDATTETTATDPAPTSSKKAKKKSKKKKKKSANPASPEVESEEGLDEIDRALQSLRTDAGQDANIAPGPDRALLSFYELLSTDSRHLNPLNEMKKLFGSSVIGSPDGESNNRRRTRGPQHLDLGASLTARHMGRGQSLAGLALRRNVFMLGKEDWPKGTSGGLGMELVEEAEDFTVEYKFVHGSGYQSTQRQFDLCVDSMDPQRMISHLHLNPYHIATLLQVSEIAKHQGDHAVAVDLLERALFTFGRSVHSSFANAMAQGKARLDFRRPENREFWLAAYRYIGTLGTRGTHRTAYEWAKLLLSLDPEQDPYCMHLVMDQLAIKGAQFESLVKLAETPTDLIDWGQRSPNVQISLSIAYYKLKRIPEAQDTLRKVATESPWVLANLCTELNLEPIPPAVWGRTPRTPREELHALTYGLRAKDIWNTPESLAFLRSVLEPLPRTEPPLPSTFIGEKDLSQPDLRHIILSENPTLMSLLPRTIADLRNSASDPLPPIDDMPSYGNNGVEPTREEWEEELDNDQREAAGLQTWFGGILRRLGVNINSAAGPDDAESVNRVAEAIERSGLDINEIARNTSRMEELRDREAIATRRLQELEQGVENAGASGTGTTGEEEGIGNFIIQQPETPPPANPSLPVERAPLQPFLEEDPDEEPTPGPSTTTQTQPLLRPATPPSPPASNTYDDSANQRWLAGRGLLRLKAFVSEHGADENVWKDDLNVDITPATEYAHRITLLKQRSSRDFILNYALRQGAGNEAGDLIKRLLG